MNGRNLINQIKLAQMRRTIQTKIKKILSVKSIKAGNLNNFFINLVIALSFFVIINAKSEDTLLGKKTYIKILDKISSKNELVGLNNDEEFIYKDLAIKSMKCANSEFDDNPEIKAYIQVKDVKNENKDNVFVFNGWMFSSSPSIKPFDHAVYDIWLTGCR